MILVRPGMEERMQAPGKIVKVNDTYMHVYHIPQQIADHKNTIIFLSGSGTECPTFDFKPLWYLLAGESIWC